MSLDKSFGKAQYVEQILTQPATQETYMHLTPAEYVVHVFQGVRLTARAIGRSPASVSKWSRPRTEKGADGQIPSAAQRRILEIAKKAGLDITPDDLMFGRKVPKRLLKKRHAKA